MSDESFLSRWSRLKRKEAEPAPPAPEPAPEPDLPVAAEPGVWRRVLVQPSALGSRGTAG